MSGPSGPKDPTKEPRETLKVLLTGRQCRIVSWVFTDFLEAAVLLPEMPLDLLLICRSIVAFSRLHAEHTHNGNDNDKITITISIAQAHFIAFAMTLEAMRRIPNRPDLLEVINAIGAAFVHKKEK